MAAQTTKNLYLSITGNADGLSAASKAAKSALLDVGTAGADMQKAVQDSFRALGGGNPTSTPDQRTDAQTKLDQIGQQHDLKTQQINQQNADPITAYMLQLHQATDDTNAALQGVEVDGLKGLEDGLLGIITGTESVASAFKKMATSIISDLARIAIEKAIVGALGSIFGGAFGGTTSAGTDAVYGGDLGGVYADGGHVTGPGSGTSDSILARLSNGEFVMNAEATKRNLPLLHAMNDNLMGFAEGGLVGMPDLSSADMRGLRRSGNLAVAMGDIHLSAPGADPAQLARLQAAFEQSQQQMPARVIAAVQDAKTRMILR